jgi:very-short-patch-repair endonuclease
MRSVDAPARLGVTPHVVRRLLEEGVLIRLRRGVLVGQCLAEKAGTDPEFGHELALRTLLVPYGGAVAAQESAALALGLPVLDRPDRPVLLRPNGAWRGGDTGRVRIAPLPMHHRTEVAGIPCTTAARTVIDVARSASFRAAVVLGDAALRGLCSEADLQAMLAECSAWSDLGKARKVLPFLDARSESPFESLSRAVMHEYKLPAPEPQQWLTGADGVDYRVDFYWKQQRLIGEADGRMKYQRLGADGTLDPEAAERAVWMEKIREDALREAGERFVRWTYRQMRYQTDETIARIARGLASG